MRRSQKSTTTYRIACMTAVMGLLLVDPPGYGEEVGRTGAARPVLALQRQLGAHDQATLADADPVDRQLARYARRVPEMGFLRLYGDKAAGVLRKLPALLGEGALNLDYEHDASARRTLIDVQMHRIGVMVGEALPSATLFRTGKGSAFDHPYLCVITLDSRPYRRDPHEATRFLTSEFGGAYPVQNKKLLIDNGDFLTFAVDHEVFHCLDAYFNGPPIRKTHDALYGHYQAYLNEARADAFASQMHKSNGQEPDRFLETFAALRTLSLLGLDLFHFTGDVIRRSMNAPPVAGVLDLEEQVAASRALADKVATSASRYGIRLASAVRLLERLGQDADGLLSALEGARLPRHDESQVAALFQEVRQAQRMLEAAAVPGMRRSATLTQNSVPQLAFSGDPPRRPNIDRSAAYK